MYDTYNSDFIFPVLFLSLILTLISYGLFPLLFAGIRRSPIYKKRYTLICYGVNFAVMLVFIFCGSTSSGAPYLLWTWVASSIGKKILNNNGYLLENKLSTIAHTTDPDIFDKKQYDAAPEEQEEFLPSAPPIRFCRKCGAELLPNSDFCSNCGTAVIKE